MLFQKSSWEKEDEIHHPFLFFSILSTPEFHGRQPRRLLLWYKYFRTSLRLSQFVYWPISILDFPLFDFCRVFIFLNAGHCIYKKYTILYTPHPTIHKTHCQSHRVYSTPLFVEMKFCDFGHDFFTCSTLFSCAVMAKTNPGCESKPGWGLQILFWPPGL